MNHLVLIFLMFFWACTVNAENGPPQEQTDPIVDAQEKLLNAKGTYKTIKAQEDAIESMRKATKLSLKAAKLRARAEKLQAKADVLVSKANQVALSRGLYITGASAPVMNQPPSHQLAAPAQTASAPSFVPVPGQPINIIVPKQEEVSYQENNGEGFLPPP